MLAMPSGPPSPSPGWGRGSRRRPAGSAPEPDTADRTGAADRDEGRDGEPKGLRIQKLMAEAGVASRRECERLIEDGHVAVNGTVVRTLPIWVVPGRDRVTVRGKPVLPVNQLVYVMFFKPRGVICSNDDPEGRTRAIDLVRHPSKARLYPVGRLDLDSSGLLLLTNDGELAERLTHPRYEVHKTYEVLVRGRIEESQIKRLRTGVFLADRRGADRRRASRTLQSRLKILKQDRERTRLLIELREGRNRQVRRMLAHLGHPVKRLRRVRMGPLALKGLRPGQWRDLLPQEIEALRRAAGLLEEKSRSTGGGRRSSGRSEKGRTPGGRAGGGRAGSASPGTGPPTNP